MDDPLDITLDSFIECTWGHDIGYICELNTIYIFGESFFHDFRFGGTTDGGSNVEALFEEILDNPQSQEA